MKKIDLHIHTVKTISDADFVFSMEHLCNYVKTMKIDAIAITNHNMFDKKQFLDICSTISSTTVFPGIEINLGINSGHMLVISEASDVDDFDIRCKKVENLIHDNKDSVSLDEFKSIFPDLKKYLLIPHYDKAPHIDRSILNELSDYIQCGAVRSTKKFIYCCKEEGITPVLFSDWRADEGNDFPIRQTYIDLGQISIKSLKKSLADITKVHLSEMKGRHLFQVLPGLIISTGLTVVLGERSSGKTYTLNQINKNYDSVKYIEQFSLLERDPSKAEKEFENEIQGRNSSFLQDYFRLFALAINDASEVNLIDNEKSIDEYLETLKKNASDFEREDAFSKCRLFTEVGFSIESTELLERMISAVETLLDARKYNDIIENNIKRDDLIKLYDALVFKRREESVIKKKKEWANELISNIKVGLQSKTATTRIHDIDFYKIQMDRKRIARFNQLVALIKRDAVIYEKELENFKIRITKKAFNCAQELKSVSGRKVSFSAAYDKYDKEAYDYLNELKRITEIPDKDWYLYFANTECKILNQYGLEVSGGERAEFNLLRQIQDALQYDMLLIDEPESSFDNIFLKSHVNHLLKDISKSMPVVIVTHNNTVGASIKPDYIMYTKRTIVEGKAEFDIYTGFPGDKELISADGKTIPNIDVTLDCLEAGSEAYEERKKDYEMLKD